MGNCKSANNKKMVIQKNNIKKQNTKRNNLINQHNIIDIKDKYNVQNNIICTKHNYNKNDVIDIYEKYNYNENDVTDIDQKYNYNVNDFIEIGKIHNYNENDVIDIDKKYNYNENDVTDIDKTFSELTIIHPLITKEFLLIKDSFNITSILIGSHLLWNDNIEQKNKHHVQLLKNNKLLITTKVNNDNFINEIGFHYIKTFNRKPDEHYYKKNKNDEWKLIINFEEDKIYSEEEWENSSDESIFKQGNFDDYLKNMNKKIISPIIILPLRYLNRDINLKLFKTILYVNVRFPYIIE